MLSVLLLIMHCVIDSRRKPAHEVFMVNRAAFDESLLDMPEVTGHGSPPQAHERQSSLVSAAPVSAAPPSPSARTGWGGEDLSGQWWVVSRSRQGF